MSGFSKSRVRVQIDEPRGAGLLDDVLDFRVGDRRKDLVGVARVHIRQQELILAGGIVQGIEEPGRHSRRVAEGRMRSDVVNAFAVDVDLASVAQRFEILLPVLRPVGAHSANGFRLYSQGFFRHPFRLDLSRYRPATNSTGTASLILYCPDGLFLRQTFSGS